MTVDDAVTRGRAAFDRKAWSEAYRDLALADRQASLTPEDLDNLATAAYLVGEESIASDARARAHAGFVERGDLVRAARSAFWLGYALISVRRNSPRGMVGSRARSDCSTTLARSALSTGCFCVRKAT